MVKQRKHLDRQKDEKNDLDSDDNNNDDGKVHLKRQIGLFSATGMLVGNTIGVGIFISPKGVLQYSGSVGMSLVIWSLCGLLSLFGSLCYAELGTMIPTSGGEYTFLNKAFGPAPAFLLSWTSTLILRPSGITIVLLAFADYAVAPFYEGEDGACDPPEVSLKLFAITCLLLLAAISVYSVKISSYLINVLAIAKSLALCIIVIIGAIQLFSGNTEYLDPSVSFKGSATNFLGYGFAFYQGLFAYDGWNTITYITEEIKNPSRNLPLAIILGMPMVIVLFVFTNVAYFTAMSPDELLQSDAVAVTFAVRTMGPVSWLMPIGVMCSALGAVATNLFFCARLPYVAAREGHLPEILSMIHVKRFTPLPATTLFVTLVIILILPGSIDTLLNYFSFVNWLIFGSAVIALLWLRYKHPEWERPVKVPLIIPIVFVLVAVYLVIAPIIDDPSIEFLYAALYILAGLLFYFPFVYFKLQLPFMDKLTMYLQLFFESAPSGYNT